MSSWMSFSIHLIVLWPMCVGGGGVVDVYAVANCKLSSSRGLQTPAVDIYPWLSVTGLFFP